MASYWVRDLRCLFHLKHVYWSEVLAPQEDTYFFDKRESQRIRYTIRCCVANITKLTYNGQTAASVSHVWTRDIRKFLRSTYSSTDTPANPAKQISSFMESQVMGRCYCQKSIYLLRNLFYEYSKRCGYRYKNAIYMHEIMPPLLKTWSRSFTPNLYRNLWRMVHLKTLITRFKPMFLLHSWSSSQSLH